MKRNLLLIITLVLSGCASYKTSVLQSKDPNLLTRKEEFEGLTVAVDIFNRRDTKRIFQFNLQSKDVQPVLIIIDNKSKKTYEFSTSCISKHCYSAEQVADKVKFNTAGRATAYGVGGLLFFPLFIPAIIDGYGSSKANDKIKDDYIYKSIQEFAVIPPAGNLTGCVYLPNLKPGETFSIKLINTEDRTSKIFTFRN